MAAVTIKDETETLGCFKAYIITIAATGDTLETPFSRIINVQCTSESTSAANTYIDYDKSGGKVTFNGAGTGFAGDWSVLVVGLP